MYNQSCLRHLIIANIEEGSVIVIKKTLNETRAKFLSLIDLYSSKSNIMTI